jgi:glycosyltransferase involved in cell wall biosynthesis
LVDSPAADDLDVAPATICPVEVPDSAWRYVGGHCGHAAGAIVYAGAAYREVMRLHDREPVDVVLAPLWRSEGAVCLLDHRFPTVVSCMTSLRTMVDVDKRPLSHPDIGSQLAFEAASLKRSPYLHGLTEAVLTKTISDFDLHPAHAAVISRGLRDRFVPEAGTGASELATILFVGRIEPRKGVDTLLDALTQLVDEGVPASLIIAGPEFDPSFRMAFARRTEDRPEVRAAVSFRGAVSDDELSRLYQAADIVCVPSRYESHGIVLVEAMMFGKALVSCIAGGISEVAEHEANALLCPPEDPAALAVALRRLIEDDRLRQRLGDAGRLTYERRFAVGVIAAEMEAFLRQVIAHHRDAHAAAADLEAKHVQTRFTDLIADVLPVPRRIAARLAAELVGPPVAPWRAWSREGYWRFRGVAGSVKHGIVRPIGEDRLG